MKTSKRFIKRILSMLLATVMVTSMALPACAATVKNIGISKNGIIVRYSDGTSETFDADHLDEARAVLKAAGYSDAVIEANIGNFITTFTDLEYQSELIQWELYDETQAYEPFKYDNTSNDADIEVFSDTHIGRDWAELDWTDANDAYAVLTVNELPGPNTRALVTVQWYDGHDAGNTCDYKLTEGEWTIPLPGGTAKYLITVRCDYLACEHNRTEEENTAFKNSTYETIKAKFDAEIADPEAVWLFSTPYVDFENAPKTRAKALEITKNCKTDAQKITAVFNWVSANIKYDRKLSDLITLEDKNTLKRTDPSCAVDSDGWHMETKSYEASDYHDLDRILTSKSGVCEHYAVLMAGMLRSLGVPCKMVYGMMYTGSGNRNDDANWGPHAWVVVNPETGKLNKSALGAGNDLARNEQGKKVPTGWTRLDPTNANFKDTTSNDANYKINYYY